MGITCDSQDFDFTGIVKGDCDFFLKCCFSILALYTTLQTVINFKIPPCISPFSSDDPLCPLAVHPMFLLDPVVSLFYTLPIKKQVLTKSYSTHIYRLWWEILFSEEIFIIWNHIVSHQKGVFFFLQRILRHTGKARHSRFASPAPELCRPGLLAIR